MSSKPQPGPRPSKGGRRKIGRNEKKCAGYRARNRENNEGQRKHVKLTRGLTRKGADFRPAVRPATGKAHGTPDAPGHVIYS